MFHGGDPSAVDGRRSPDDDAGDVSNKDRIVVARNVAVSAAAVAAAAVVA